MWGYGYGYPMMGYEGFGVIGAIFSVFWLVVLAMVIVTAVRWLRGKPIGHGHHHGCGGSALEILKERYAKGEIDRAEFEAKKKDLEV